MAEVTLPKFDSAFFSKYTTPTYFLDRGGFGSVYGPIPWNDTKLAIKSAMFSEYKVTEKFEEDLKVKECLWTSLIHKNLMKILSVNLSQLPKALYILMDFADGGSLYRTLRSLGSTKKLPIDIVTDWATQVADGMLYLHVNNIIHKDLKSANILLMEKFEYRNRHKAMTLKITDFDDIKQTEYSAIMTSLVITAAYAAPEVLTQQRVSSASDVYSFGVLIWEMLSGNIPHEGLNQRVILSKVVDKTLENLSMNESIPEDYRPLLTGCWMSECQNRITFYKICDEIRLMEWHAVRINDQFLLENMKPSYLIPLLQKEQCIKAEDLEEFTNLPEDIDKNQKILKWMRKLRPWNKRGQKVLECFRQAKQNFVAELLAKGGVLVKSKISTELAQNDISVESSSENDKELGKKEDTIIEKLKQKQGLPLPLSGRHDATSEISDDDIIIAPYCNKEDGKIVIWFWCQSINDQKDLQSANESGMLLRKLTTVFKDFSNDIVSSPSKWLVPTSIHILMGDFEARSSETAMACNLQSAEREDEARLFGAPMIEDESRFCVAQEIEVIPLSDITPFTDEPEFCGPQKNEDETRFCVAQEIEVIPLSDIIPLGDEAQLFDTQVVGDSSRNKRVTSAVMSVFVVLVLVLVVVFVVKFVLPVSDASGSSGDTDRMPPSITRDPPRNLIYRGDGSVELDCKGWGMPAVTYEWKKNGVTFNQNLRNIRRDIDGTITMDPATSMDEGFYQCFVTNRYGTALSISSHLQEAFIESAPVIPEVVPIKVSAQSPFHVKCDARKSFPKPEYSWETTRSIDDRYPVHIQSTERIQIAENGDLHFGHGVLEKDDEIFYRCFTFNPFMNIKEGGNYAQLQIISRGRGPSPVRDPSGFFSDTPTVAVIGGNITLRCFFHGNWNSTNTWNGPGPGRTLPAGRYTLDLFNTSLTIYNINKSDEGPYSCTAPSGRMGAIIDLRVEAAPVFPAVTDGPYDVNVTEGNSFTFRCYPVATPAAKIVWLRNGYELDPDNLPTRFVFNNSGRSLTIRDVCRDCVDRDSKTDLMVIQCNASNVHGYAFAQGYLNVFSNSNITDF